MEELRTKNIWMLALHINITCFLFGYGLGVFSSVSASISSAYNWGKNSEYEAWCYTFIPLGALIGSGITELVTRKYGRRGGIFVSNLIYSIGSLVVLADSSVAIGISRFTVGIACGMCMTLPPIYINEIVPVQLAGKIGPTMSIFTSFGLTVAYFFGAVVEVCGNSKALWMGILLFPLLLSAYQTYFFVFVQGLDSPYWYKIKNEQKLLKQSLEAIYTENGIWRGYENLQCVDNDLNESLSNGASKLSYSEIFFSRKYSRMLRFGIILAVLHQLTGVNAIIFYSYRVFQDLKADPLESRILTLIMGFILLASNILSIVLLKHFGRKTLIVSGQVLLAIDLTVLAFLSNSDSASPEVKSIFVMLFLVAFSYSFGATMWMYLGELTNDKIMSISGASNLIANSLISYFFPYVLGLLGEDLTYLFLFFAVMMVIGAVYSHFDLIETSGLNKCVVTSILTNQ